MAMLDDHLPLDAPAVEPETRVDLPYADINHPSDGELVERAVLEITGWAATENGPCSRVELIANGRPIGRARLGDARPDAVAATGLATALLSGFHARVDLAALPWLESVLELGGIATGIEGETVPLPVLRLPVAPAAPALEIHARGRTSSRARRAGAHLPDREALRLLVCVHELDYNGAPLFLTELLRRMAEQRPLEGLVISPRDGPTREDLESIGLEVHVTSPYPLSAPHDYDTRLEELCGWVRGRRFDVALANTIVSFPGAELAKRLGLPLMWVIHESYTLPEFWATYGDALHPLVREHAEATLRQAELVAFAADATRVLYEPDLPGVPCITLAYGIDVDALDRWRAGFDRKHGRRLEAIPDDAVVLLCMGSISARKAQTQLIYAFARIAERHPQAMLLIVGARPDTDAGLARQAVALHGLEHRVRIMPVVSDPRPLYGIADLLVSSSDVESVPRSMLEAMALGIPIVATGVFGVSELLTDRQTAWLFEPRDVSAMARALDRVLSLDPAERAAVARRARAVVETDYRSDVCSREWLRALEGVAATTRTGVPG